MQIRYAYRGDVVVVEIDEVRLDKNGIAQLAKALHFATAKGGYRFIVNLLKVETVESLAIEGLLSLKKQLRGKGNFVIGGVQPHILRLFQVTRVSKIIPLFPTESAALKEMLVPDAQRSSFTKVVEATVTEAGVTAVANPVKSSERPSASEITVA